MPFGGGRVSEMGSEGTDAAAFLPRVWWDNWQCSN